LDRERAFLVATGLIIGILAAVLVVMGNPGNMGFCIACFLRDITGALGFQRAGVVQYVRPEILGLVIGAFVAAFTAGEFRSRGGSSTLVRFFLGMFMMIGALVFLGCPLRDILRIGGGDLNAVVGLAGFIGGVLLGVFFLRKGFDLGAARTDKGSQVGGYILIAVAVVLLIMLVGGFNVNPEAGGPLFFSKEGPGSMHAPLWISLGAGLLVGFLAQKARLCLSGGFRDFFLIREYGMLLAYLGILVGVMALNIYFGNFRLGFADQPIAHTNHIFNFLGLFLVGLSAVLLGGCPLRQIVLGSEGDTDAATAVLGMVAGAAISHNFLLAAGPGGTTPWGEAAVIIGIIVVSFIGWAYREVEA
jgi:YedE family putative selenium metabolism protein